jgi:hypothetical protein
MTVLMMVAAMASVLAAQESSPEPMVLERNLPLVKVMVNGKGPFTFGIDTGTGGDMLLSSELIQTLALVKAGEAEVGDPSGKNGRTVSVFHVDKLKFAGVEFKDLNATEYPGKMMAGTDGILGFKMFHDYLLTLDYPQQQVSVTRGSLPSANGDDVIPFTMPDNVPMIELKVGDRTVEAHVDSRGPGLGLPEKFAAELKFVSEPMVIGRGRTVSNEFEIKGAQLAGDVRFGGYTFTRPFVAIQPMIPMANFGARALMNFAVTFDQKHQVMRFAASKKSFALPGPSTGKTPPPPKP